MYKTLLCLTMLFVSTQGKSQNIDLQAQLKKHISTLASDKLEGRETGTQGEKLAAAYITSIFSQLGLKASADSGYYQSFPFFKKYDTDKSSFNQDIKAFKQGKDFYVYPTRLSGQTSGHLADVGYGINAPALGYNSYSGLSQLNGKVFLIQMGHPENGNPHSRFESLADVQSKIDTAISYGAIAVIFTCSNDLFQKLKPDYYKRLGRETIPALLVNASCMQHLKANILLPVAINCVIKKEMGTGYNLIGTIDNNKPYTVVLSAHYDHLGYGEEGSLYTGKKAIHNGADDNASGVASILELARVIKQSGLKNYNYTFIAFSGEEKGLLGSNYYVKQASTTLSAFNYNINLDMVGRLSTTEPVLLINGVGTATEWPSEIEKLKGVKIKTTSSGIGPSDQTSFYLSNIPAIHFFSGTHTDYHKPTDDENKINYEGTITILNMLSELITSLDAKPKLTFTKTNDSAETSRPRFKVTLGVIPDYAFEGEGMRIDGVSPSKPADVAGLKKGDVILKIGDVTISDMSSYMKALGNYAKGDAASVTFKRGQEILSKSVTF
jgi:aminopeptidase YwaD